MSKKPLADDRRRALATEAFSKLVRAAFKGETDKVAQALTAIETQFGEEIDILDRARRFAAIRVSGESSRSTRPKNASERLLTGIMALNADDLEAAEREVAQVISEAPKNADAHYVLAIVQARRAAVEEAIASLSTACSLSPERRAQAPLDSEFASLVGNPAFDALTTA